jgi:hypothetical protein
MLPATLAALIVAVPPVAAQTVPAPSLSIDTLFAPPSGIVVTDFPPPGTAGTRHDIPAAVAVHGNRTYTVGVTGTSTSGDGRDIAIAALRPNGTLDAGFSGDGKHTLSVGTEADIGTGIVVLPNGNLRVLAATDVNSTTSDDTLDVAVIGLRPDGSPDTTFGPSNGRVVLTPGPGNDVPARIEAGPLGRLAIVGSRSDGTRDDLFVALLNANGTPVTGPPTGFGTTGIRFTATSAIIDRGVDVVFRPGGGFVAWTSVDPPATANDAAAVLRAFKADGTVDTAFGAAGPIPGEVVVANTDGVPGGLIVHGGRLWASGTTKVGNDTDAFLARTNADGTGLQLRRFDMRGRFLPAGLAAVSESHELVAVPGVPETLVAIGSVTYSIDGGGPFTDWGAAAFNGLGGNLSSASYGDIVIQAAGNGELVSAAASSQGWLVVTGTHLDSDNNFANARLLIDADKACDLAVAAGEPGEIVFRGSSPAALTARVQNVGSQPCAGTLRLPSPYRMGPIGTGVVAPGDTFTAARVPVTYHGPRRAEDILTIELVAADASAANNRALTHVVFSYCDLEVRAVGGAGAIPTEGTRRFELSLRNLGTATCRVRVGSGVPYPIAGGRSASDTLAVAAPARARPGTRVPVVLRASAAGDVEPANNAVRRSPQVVRVGDSNIVSWGSRRFAGTARRGAGDLSKRRLRPARVDVAVLRLGRKRCSWLSSSRGRFTTRRRGRDGDCDRPRWLRAAGTKNWRFALRNSLPAGRYAVSSRTTIRAGFPEARFSGKDRNRIRFRVG